MTFRGPAALPVTVAALKEHHDNTEPCSDERRQEALELVCDSGSIKAAKEIKSAEVSKFGLVVWYL